MADIRLQNENNRGKVTYNESIINGIVALAVGTVEGVSLKTGKFGKRALKDCIKIVSDKKGIHVTVKVGVLYGYNVPDVAIDIQHGIKQTVEEMSRYHIADVDVYIDDVFFEDRSAEAE
mgnify:CR=1 FL=1